MVPVDICMRVMCMYIVRMIYHAYACAHGMVCMHIIGSRIQRSHSWHVLESELEHVPWCMHARQHTCTRTQTSITSAIYGADKHHFSMVTEHGRLVMFRTCWTSRMCTPLLALGKAIEQDTKGCLGSLAFPSPGCLSCLDYTRLSASHSESLAVCACDAPL